jgi:hypothetical protein
MQHEGSTLQADALDDRSGTSQVDSVQQDQGESNAAEASVQARQRRRIAQLEEKLEFLAAGRKSKQRYDHYSRHRADFSHSPLGI